MKGFTLVETLVAITIVLLAVMGPFQLVKDSLLASYTARDQLIAIALAEEGLEQVRSIRDDNYLYVLAVPSSTRDWLYGLTASPDCFSTNGCLVDPLGSTVASQCGSTCTNLYLKSTGVYTNNPVSGDTVTKFVRKVKLDLVDGARDKTIKVTVTVTYTTAHVPFTVTVTDYLYNWL